MIILFLSFYDPTRPPGPPILSRFSAPVIFHLVFMKVNEQNAEEEIREAFKVFDGVRDIHKQEISINNKCSERRSKEIMTDTNQPTPADKPFNQQTL